MGVRARDVNSFAGENKKPTKKKNFLVEVRERLSRKGNVSGKKAFTVR